MALEPARLLNGGTQHDFAVRELVDCLSKRHLTSV